MKPLFSQKFAILTAENPRYGSAEGGNAALEQEMKAKNLKFTPMKGKYGTPENSYLVENPDHQDILSWGKKYGQDSVIVSDGGLHKMVYTNGPHEGLWHEGHSITIHNQEPEDFYSTINLNNKPTHFTIDFDMDKKHGNPMKKTLNKMLKSLFPQKLPLYSEYIEPLQKGEKFPHFLKFMGNHPKAQETAQWADENIKHRNLAELAMRHAKTKPEGLNDEEKTHVKHFNDSLHMPEVQKAAGLITSQHDFASGIGLLKEAESAYQKRHAKEAPTLVPTEGEKLLDFGDGVGVYNLGKSKNANEAKAMGHCATPHKGGELWSIRRDHGNGMVEPLVTISHEGGYLGEMKGKHNWKPSTKHHGHIAKLLASDKIKGFVGGGYAPESNFEISDLSEGLRNKLLEYKPSLIQKVYKENLPKGFQGDYSHTPEIKSIFNTSDLAAQQKYLAKFSKNTPSHINVRYNVAKNPNTHPDILHKLAVDSDEYVRTGIAENPNTHPDILHKLAVDSDEDVRRGIAENPNTHPDILHKLAVDSDEYVRSNVAKNPNTHPDILHKLAEDSDEDVRYNVAKSSNTRPDILHKLAVDSDKYVRTGIAKNPNTHPDILHKLAVDSDEYVRTGIAENPNTHPDILHKLAVDSDEDVRRGIAKNPNTHPDILHKLAVDSDEYVRTGIAENPNTHPDILHKLAVDSDEDVRRGIAKNPNTHPDILHKLAVDSDEYVRRGVTLNPQFKNLPLEIQQKARPLVKTPIQKIIAMINDGENNPDSARQATEELKLRRQEKYDKILSPEGNLSDIQHLSESHDNDIAKRARDELKRRGLQKSLKKSDSPKHLIHFSTTPKLTTLDPEFQGTAGRHSPETKHGKPTHPRVYFYEEGTPTESVVTGGAKSKYIIKHPGDDKIIDIAKDTEGLQQQAKEQWLQKPIGSMQDAYFKLLKDKGYLGFKNSASGLPNVVAMFHATPVHAEVPMPKDMSANPDWTKAEVPMSLKKSDVKEAVEKIKGPAKVNEVLDAAQPDMRSKILAALRKEKLAKMNGTGIPGTGGATPPAMRPPVPAAPASMAMSKADESESHMAKKDLKDIMEYAQALDKMVVESEDLEDWVDSKITVARQYLSDIAHYLSYEHGQPTEELDKGDVVSIKDKKVISTDTKAAPKTMVAKQPTAAVYKRGTELAIDSGWKGDAGKTGGKPDLSLVKSKAKFERCVLAVKQKSKDKVNPWAVCHASVGDAKKSEDLEKAEMKVKEQEKPTKGMPQAKQLKADADLEKIKEGAENVAKAADKKKK